MMAKARSTRITTTEHGVVLRAEAEREMTEAEAAQLKATEHAIGTADGFLRAKKHPWYGEAMQHPSPAVRRMAEQEIDRIEERERIQEVVRETIAERAAQTPTFEPPDTINWLNNRNYAINGTTVHVTSAENDVLTAVLEADGHIDADGLVRKSGRPTACRIIRTLHTRYGGIFAPAIDLPGGKGKGGYVVRIRPKTE